LVDAELIEGNAKFKLSLFDQTTFIDIKKESHRFFCHS
jgi:hypothetical protein